MSGTPSKLRKGDSVVVIAGKNKGATGTVQRVDHARALVTDDARGFGRGRVDALPGAHLREIQAAGLGPHPHCAGARLGVIGLSDGQDLRSAVLSNPNRSHRAVVPGAPYPSAQAAIPIKDPAPVDGASPSKSPRKASTRSPARSKVARSCGVNRYRCAMARRARSTSWSSR